MGPSNGGGVSPHSLDGTDLSDRCMDMGRGAGSRVELDPFHAPPLPSQKQDRRGSISRILCPLSGAAVIPLDRRLPAGSSDVPEDERGPRNLVFVLLRVGFAARRRHRRRGSLPIVSPTPRSSRGRLLSVALSPDRSGPPLAATLPSGVRTFLPPRSATSDCLTLSGHQRR